MTIRNLDAALEPRAIAVVGDGPLGRGRARQPGRGAASPGRCAAATIAGIAAACRRRPTSRSSRRRPTRSRGVVGELGGARLPGARWS